MSIFPSLNQMLLQCMPFIHHNGQKDGCANETQFVLQKNTPLLPCILSPLEHDETPHCRLVVNGHDDMRYQTDTLPRALILCPQGGITFEDNQQCLGIGGSDFGGQLVYIKELATNLKNAGFPAVDIVTRRFSGDMPNGDPWPSHFNTPIEEHSEDPNVRVIRLPCGGDLFLPKEQLWKSLPEWSSHIENFYTHDSNKLYELESETTDKEGTLNTDKNTDKDTQSQPLDFRHLQPVVTAHYADAGLCAHLLKRNAQFPFATMTAHSLGAQKKNNYLEQGQDIAPLRMQLRLPSERKAIRDAGAIICNSKIEAEEQWHDQEYLAAIGENEDKLQVIPPGIAPIFWAPGPNHTPLTNEVTRADMQEARLALKAAIQDHIPKERQSLPTILLCGRLDRKKGYKQTIEAYAKSPALQAKANIAIVFGDGPAIFKNPEAKTEGDTLAYVQEMNSILDRPIFADKLIMPDIPQVRQAHLAQMYHLLSQEAQGIYCHSAFQEPFGLALTEAMAGGMLIAATDNGGPVSILDQGACGELMDVNDHTSIETALLNILNASPEQKHELQFAASRKAEAYSWKKTGEAYAKLVVSHLASLGSVNTP